MFLLYDLTTKDYETLYQKPYEKYWKMRFNITMGKRLKNFVTTLFCGKRRFPNQFEKVITVGVNEGYERVDIFGDQESNHDFEQLDDSKKP